jgi:hypothetical protein
MASLNFDVSRLIGTLFDLSASSSDYNFDPEKKLGRRKKKGKLDLEECLLMPGPLTMPSSHWTIIGDI